MTQHTIDVRALREVLDRREPVTFDRQPIAATLAEVRERTDVLGLSEEDFVRCITARVPPTPANYERIVALNEAGRLPGGDPTDLETGANRCAVG